MWREVLLGWSPEVSLSEPARTEQIHKAETALGVVLPEELVSLLLESNGVTGDYGLGLIWPLERIIADNLAFRGDADFAKSYMPFHPLLFFADAGNGDQFAFAITTDGIRRSDVFAWDHENDSRTWVAPSLAKYLEWWLSGDLKL